MSVATWGFWIHAFFLFSQNSFSFFFFFFFFPSICIFIWKKQKKERKKNTPISKVFWYIFFFSCIWWGWVGWPLKGLLLWLHVLGLRFWVLRKLCWYDSLFSQVWYGMLHVWHYQTPLNSYILGMILKDIGDVD